tara:strand:+ start:1673 stop:2551 length:879 start_codon:yes stop_codon:yes gene_type:complete
MLRIFLILIWLPCSALSQSIPEPLSDSVNDYAALLSPDQSAAISRTLRNGRQETGVHIVLATIARQSDYRDNGRFADFATRWFNAWGIGDATRNDGILILVSRGDREVRIALGKAYGPVWDGRAQRVIDTAMLPAFRGENYARGLADGVAAAMDRLARPFAAKEEATDTSGFPAKIDLASLAMMVIAAVMALAIAFHGFGNRIAGAFLKLKRCPNCGETGLVREDKIGRAATETTNGTVFRHIRCPTCGHDQISQRNLPSFQSNRGAGSSGGSGGGSSSGGSSSGGGASGKW